MKVPRVPGPAQSGREGVPLAAEDFQGACEFILQDEQALVRDPTVDHDGLVAHDVLLFANGLIALDWVPNVKDEPLPAREPALDVPGDPRGINSFEDLEDASPRRSFSSL